MNGFSRRQAMLLAALLDADGAVVSYRDLGDVVGSRGVDDSDVIRSYVQRLRALGVTCVEVVPRRGCRLVALPPDWALDDVLVLLDAMRRDEMLASLVLWRKAS